MPLELHGYQQSTQYIPGKMEQSEGCAPAPLDAQMSMLLNVLTELTQLVNRLEPPSALRAIQPDKPVPIEGLTALVAACQSEAGTLGMGLRSVVERIGRL